MKRLILVLGLLLPLEAGAAVLSANLQPYGVCTTTGCGEPAFDADLFSATWAQADIAFTILPPRRTDPLDVATARPGQLDPVNALAAFRRSVPEVGPHTLYLGFTEPLDAVYGVAYLNTPQTLTYPFGIVEAGLPPRVAGLVAAHEVGHLLGAAHVTGPTDDNLMRRGVPERIRSDDGFVPPLLPETVAAARSSPLLVPVSANPLLAPVSASPLLMPVPAPPSLALGLSGLLLAALGARAKRRSRGRPNREHPVA